MFCECFGSILWWFCEHSAKLLRSFCGACVTLLQSFCIASVELPLLWGLCKASAWLLRGFCRASAQWLLRGFCTPSVELLRWLLWLDRMFMQESQQTSLTTTECSSQFFGFKIAKTTERASSMNSNVGSGATAAITVLCPVACEPSACVTHRL